MGKGWHTNGQEAMGTLRERTRIRSIRRGAKDKVREDEKKKMMHKNATRDLYYLKMYYKILCFS